ncbi:uncharacterized protein LOC132063973 isoform X1 [Lycium ferocissimum]|uniref:uncharacterized protein LOC132063973 isoform X1 n=1 Tax=Lycium ferocissimum TaxID=112874 RepID=UPI00281669EC|nr:uncharacterized protein LOC132063973 isoform X1 [Lycium ferocissimum]
MGCCFSSSKKRRRTSQPCSAINGRDPPPLEEETVKEVLSETPIPKPHHHPPKVLVNHKEADFPQQVKINESTAVAKPIIEPTSVVHNNGGSIKLVDQTKFESTMVNKSGSIKSVDEVTFESAATVVNKGGSIKSVDEVKFESAAAAVVNKGGSIKLVDEIRPEVSEEQTSEMCSFTESYSTTATATEKREEDGEVTQRSPIRVHRKRQNSGDLTGVRERNFRSGRSAPSPEKKRSPAPATSRGVQGRGMPQQRRNVGPTNGPRRGPGDNVVRRSNSPAARGPVDARRSVRNRSPAAAREVESPAEKPKEEVSPETGESLENPLVSMECFIFL